MPTVSIIIPTYNRAILVKESIQSVLEQTYTDYEIIVVDDGSTDNTRETVAAFSDKIIYVYQQNRGRSNARNHGISLAKGNYIAFLDSDDLFLPGKLEKQVEVMEKNPGVLLSHTSYQCTDIEKKYIETVKSGSFTGNVYPKIIGHCPIATPTVMVRRSVFSEEIKFKETLSTGEDAILWIQIARKSPILGIEEPLSIVRIDERSASMNPRVQIKGIINIINNTVGFNAILMARILPVLLSRGLLFCWRKARCAVR
jgi:glycosyltransferase involved in cell wall biosynthesis